VDPERCGKTRTNYVYHGCRCDPCRLLVNRYQRSLVSTWRKRQFADRVLVDGRLVAAHLPADFHGVLSTYTNHGCRCVQCTAANTVYMREHREAAPRRR